MPDVEKTGIFGTAVHVVLRSLATPPGEIRSRLEAAGVPVVACAPVEPSLEDVFLDVAERPAP
jgi:hypothetical protein